jgi:hypothetical protein
LTAVRTPGWGMVVVARDTREGWPLLTVETEANGDSTSTYERVLSWLVHWASYFLPKKYLSVGKEHFFMTRNIDRRRILTLRKTKVLIQQHNDNGNGLITDTWISLPSPSLSKKIRQ